MGLNKAPGRDGFSGHFYRKYWEVIGPQVCQEVKSFFQNSKMPAGWNDTHIVLILKVSHPEEVSQFRPISCCNFNYKIISKIMATRIKKWIPSIVSDMQAAFTIRRAIQDNIMIVHEVMHHFKNRSGKFKWDMMIKMDMKKAYDMVEWDDLREILRAMGFQNRWCKWIKECIRTVRFSVLFNGIPIDPFHPSRGIRQGDPMSPFLFILLTNSLSFLIDKGIRERRLRGIKLNNRCPTLTYVLFADDIIIFSDRSDCDQGDYGKICKPHGPNH
ncbi:LINE-1 retrotransposable element ORF2 protein [Linum perenne]